jgi:hypothetical protein
MIEVIVVGEGQTEETFVRDVLAAQLAPDGLLLQARLVPLPGGGRGGALSYPRVELFLRNTLRQRPDTYVTTFFDLYALNHNFPGFDEAAGWHDPIRRATFLEARLHESIIQAADCRPDRFVAYIQPYEFEGLLFTDVEQLTSIEPNWGPFTAQLREIRATHVSPEHINDGSDTHPSARLARILQPGYDKTRHGPIALQRIGLARLSAECQHFAEWLGRMRSLRPLRGVQP